jgi:KipI family sensor histidine kinase inhibitor
VSGAASRPALRWSGDTLILVDVGRGVEPAVNARAVALARALADAAVRGVRDIVPAYASVGVHVDPLRFDQAALEAVLHDDWQDAGADGGARQIEIPVCYGGGYGPDLGDVAAFAGCSEDDVVARHAAGRYRVYMLGFLPGFAYLGGVDASIGMPRRASPRAVVPAGSVGIAGGQTGVYPYESPGGWQLIGRTPVRMFDPDRSPPALLAPGDQVRFVPLAADRWDDVAARTVR